MTPPALLVRSARPPREVRAAALALPAGTWVASLVLFAFAMRLAVRGWLPTWGAFALVPATFMLSVAMAYRLAASFGLTSARPLFARHGFGLVALGAALALPMLGAFSLVDPWETHYAEVAREMLERRDFVSPWWGHEGWFTSKPVLTFWLEAISMRLFGVGTGPDAVLAGGAHPEWAVRFPTFAFASLGSYVLYYGVSRTCGRRAGALGALVLWTMPGFALLSHQAITDMPLVSGVAGALGLLLCALDATDEARVGRVAIVFGRRVLLVHAGQLLALVVAVLAGSQVVMLVLEHVHVGAGGLSLGPDRLVAGSPHACGLPGHPACARVALAHPRLQPAVQAAIVAPAATWLVVRIASETRAARLFALGAWVFAAVAAMGKGPAGLVLPAFGVLAWVASRRSLGPLARLEIATGLLLAVVLIAPWYLAVFARHGRWFLDELVMRHMLGRTLGHLHDTNEGEDVGIAYFVKQLGYATFPWCGVLAAATLSLPTREDVSRRGSARTLLYGATLLGFALVSAMRTKFHHYVLVTVPPAAMLGGLWLDERLEEAARHRGGRGRLVATAAASVCAACVVALVARDLVVAHGATRLMQLFTYRYARRWPSADALAPAFGVFGGLAATLTLALGLRRGRGAITAALGAAALAFAVFALDVYLVRAAPDGGQRGVLDAYYRARAEGDSGSAGPPLVAYQLNWKGENFYTGNHVAIFVASGAPMRAWLCGQRRGGARTFYFVTEHGRVSGLRAELGSLARGFTKMTDEHVSAEFCLVRAELEGE